MSSCARNRSSPGARSSCRTALSDTAAPVTVRPATVADVPQILAFIRGLAEYERLPDQVVATEARLRATLFGPTPAAEVLLAYLGAEPAGFALFFQNYSTFLARPGIYLEDLFVLPEYRGRGIGKVLLRALARLAVERDCGRLEWSVLDWNADAIGFYRKLGAVAMDDWTVFRLTGNALSDLAEEGF
ncbi:MAG: GNAT family N-acetyltransferase [Gemmatimonadales bacterium]|nr:GNAT family N-acetyltransferase [Gemmatimonadales bacterium]